MKRLYLNCNPQAASISMDIRDQWYFVGSISRIIALLCLAEAHGRLSLAPQREIRGFRYEMRMTLCVVSLLHGSFCLPLFIFPLVISNTNLERKRTCMFIFCRGSRKEDLGSNISLWSQMCWSHSTRGGVSGVEKDERAGPEKKNQQEETGNLTWAGISGYSLERS